MKKLILLALTAMIIAGCFEIKARHQHERRSLNVDYDIYYAPNGCEYYIYGNYHGGIPVHKQDCKYCSQRRKAELEELVRQIKEK